MNNAVTLSEKLGQASVWFDGWYLDFDMPHNSQVILPPSLWLDCRDWADVHVQVEYEGTHEDSVLVMLQTTVVPITDLCGDDDPNDATTWVDLQSAAIPVNPVATIQATSVGTYAQSSGSAAGFAERVPMGVLRLKVNASSSGLKGRLRAVVVGKKRG